MAGIEVLRHKFLTLTLKDCSALRLSHINPRKETAVPTGEEAGWISKPF